MKKRVALILVLLVSFNFLGCYALRKKFVRKRHKETPPPLYLELKEYPKVPTKDMYDEYYLFVRGWLDELIKSIEERTSSKRQKKSIDEAIENLEQIIYFYNQEGKKAIEPIHKELMSLRKKIYNPYFISSSDTSFVVRRILKLKRKFEKNFSYEKASVWMQGR